MSFAKDEESEKEGTPQNSANQEEYQDEENPDPAVLKEISPEPAPEQQFYINSDSEGEYGESIEQSFENETIISEKRPELEIIMEDQSQECSRLSISQQESKNTTKTNIS